MRSTLQRLQDWYSRQCDGDWEHGSGVHIATLDNPGWSIDVDTDGTSHEEVQFDSVQIERSEDNWIHAFRKGAKIKLRCGPGNLEESLLIFLNWVEKPANEEAELFCS